MPRTGLGLSFDGSGFLALIKRVELWNSPQIETHCVGAWRSLQEQHEAPGAVSRLRWAKLAPQLFAQAVAHDHLGPTTTAPKPSRRLPNSSPILAYCGRS